MKFSLKRTLSLLLVLVMLVGLLPTIALAEGETTPGDGDGTVPDESTECTVYVIPVDADGNLQNNYKPRPTIVGNKGEKIDYDSVRSDLEAAGKQLYPTATSISITIKAADKQKDPPETFSVTTYYAAALIVPSYTVTFVTDGGSVVHDQTVAYKETATKPTDPTKDGNSFLYWTHDGEEYDFTLPVTGNLTLVAAWEKSEHTHTLTKVIGKAATCGADGYESYWMCESCGKLFSDEAGTKEITAPIVIKATGKHTASSWKVGRYPTERRDGYMYKECTVCHTQLDYMVLTWRDAKPTLPFVDVDNKDSYFDAVCYVYEKGLMKGTSDNRFSPSRTFDRAMVAMILYRMQGRPSVKFNSVFPDVSKNDWYADCISWAYKYGVLKGYGDGTVRPDDPVTVEQLLTILYRYADSEGYDVSGRGSVNRYYDADDISNYALKAVRWAVSEGLISGRGYLSPKSNASRAEVAEILTNFCKNVLKYK